MKYLANKHILVALLSFAITSEVSQQCRGQFGGGGSSEVQEHKKKQLNVDAKNAALAVYPLKYIPAGQVEEHLDFLLGKGLARISHDEDRELLLVFTTAEINNRIAKALQILDVPAKEKLITLASKEQSPKSLQVHTFWLAAGLLDNSTTEHLPESVIEALNKIGITNPGLVAQSTTSLIAKIGDVSRAESRMSAKFNNQEMFFTNGAELSLSKEERVELHVRTQIRKPNSGEYVCELQGSLKVPLGHYMVLGTTNFVFGNSQENTLDTSRFAFVIQVVEAGSFAPEKSTRETDVDPVGSSSRPVK